MISLFCTSSEPVPDTFIGTQRSVSPRSELSLVRRFCTNTNVRYQSRRRQELHKRGEQSSSSLPPCGQPCLVASESYKTFTILANRLGACAVSWASSGPVTSEIGQGAGGLWEVKEGTGHWTVLSCLLSFSLLFICLALPFFFYLVVYSLRVGISSECSLALCSVGGRGGPGDPQPRAPQFKGAPCRLFNNLDIIAILRALTRVTEVYSK